MVSPEKFAVTVCTPRAEGENDTDADPAALVVPVRVAKLEPDKANDTVAPATAAVGALVRESVVLSDSELPTRALAGAVNMERDVAACAIVSDIVAVSATTGITPV